MTLCIIRVDAGRLQLIISQALTVEIGRVRRRVNGEIQGARWCGMGWRKREILKSEFLIRPRDRPTVVNLRRRNSIEDLFPVRRSVDSRLIEHRIQQYGSVGCMDGFLYNKKMSRQGSHD